MSQRLFASALVLLLASITWPAYGAPPETAPGKPASTAETADAVGADERRADASTAKAAAAGESAPEAEAKEETAPIEAREPARAPTVSRTTSRPTHAKIAVAGAMPPACPPAGSGGENVHPPVWLTPGGLEQARVSEVYMYEPLARDPEGAAVSYVVDKLPEGARVEWYVATFHPCDDAMREPVQELRPRIIWTPKRAQHGFQSVVIVASDGALKTEMDHQVEVRDDWEGFFMPGASYSLYVPRGADEGVFHGPAFELLIGGWIHRNENRGPSHGRVYASVGLLQSTVDVDAVSAAIGFDLSIERNPTRSYLIPFFGLEAGGLFRQGAPSIAQFTPSLGVHLITGRNLFLNISGGYLFPTARIDDLLGYTARASLNVSLW
jgi:hypothetical protein